jgi:antitoxin (DNA-binding transcriptional repressor) of toxin-antitoxin stability system
MRAISATDLARNTREILDQVAAQGETVVIERNHTIVAQIVPAQRTMTASQALAGLGPLMLTPEQAVAWLKDNHLWIAAQAIEHGYALLTLNAGDFEGLPGLRLATLAPKVQAQT